MNELLFVKLEDCLLKKGNFSVQAENVLVLSGSRRNDYNFVKLSVTWSLSSDENKIFSGIYVCRMKYDNSKSILDCNEEDSPNKYLLYLLESFHGAVLINPVKIVEFIDEAEIPSTTVLLLRLPNFTSSCGEDEDDSEAQVMGSYTRLPPLNVLRYKLLSQVISDGASILYARKLYGSIEVGVLLLYISNQN